MKFKSIILTILLGTAGNILAQQPIYKQAKAPIEQRVQDLIGRMTLEEKAGQLLCPMGWEMYQKEGNNTEIRLYSKRK